MKKFLTFLCFLILSNSFSQDAQLLDKNWYLYSMTIDQVDYPLPVSPYSNEINATVKLVFSTDLFLLSEIPCGDGYQSSISYNGTSTFEITVAGTALIPSCGYSPIIADFYTLQYEIFGSDIESPNNPFFYIISNDGHSLEVTNGSGDKAFYGDTQLLSSKPFYKINFAIAPNPVKDILSFSGIDQNENSVINIYDVFGKHVLNIESIDWNKNEIDISKLNSGIYFLKIEQKDGLSVNRKFIKQ